MSDWPTVVNTVVSLMAGGGIAIAGQSLADRRAQRREREARREDFRVKNFTTQREALMRVQDIAATISAELSAEYSRQAEAGVFFTPGTPEDMGRQLSRIDELFRQIGPLDEEISGTKSAEEKAALEGEAEKIATNVFAITTDLTAKVQRMDVVVKKEVEFFQVKLNPLIREFENNVIRTGSPSVAAAARDYLEAVKEYNYGFDPHIRRVERGRAARDKLQITVGEALSAGPFADRE